MLSLFRQLSLLTMAGPANATEEMLELMTSDGVRYNVPRACLRHSGTLDTMLEVSYRNQPSLINSTLSGDERWLRRHSDAKRFERHVQHHPPVSDSLQGRACRC